MSNYQKTIVEELKNGSKIQSTEGANYRVWLIYPDGRTRNLRRDSV